ncbi:MAG TPA: hypothetical protein VGS09_01845 [Actinomycetota bacterium]|nr:hypothetical protein [Actinomycetota bacterium]
MDWLLLAVLGIIWAVFLIPHRGPRQSVEGFERDMDMLSHLNGPGRWVLMPRRDERFLGPGGRSRARARERRRRVFVVLSEVIALTGVIGAFPPLRAMWWMTAAFLGVLAAYVSLLLRLRVMQSGVSGPPATNGALAGNAHLVASALLQGNGHQASTPTEEGNGTSALAEDELADAGIRLLAR